MPLHARRRDLVHPGGDPGGVLAGVVVERADVDERRAAQDDGLAVRVLQLGSVDGELRQPGCARAPGAARGRPARAARSAATAATRACGACRPGRPGHAAGSAATARAGGARGSAAAASSAGGTAAARTRLSGGARGAGRCAAAAGDARHRLLPLLPLLPLPPPRPAAPTVPPWEAPAAPLPPAPPVSPPPPICDSPGPQAEIQAARDSTPARRGARVFMKRSSASGRACSGGSQSSRPRCSASHNVAPARLYAPILSYARDA